MFDVAFHPDRQGPAPIARQLADHLAGLIAAGRLAAGSKLPASREVATSLGVARNTVTAAYEMLATRGLVTAHVGQGTFVAVATRGPAAPAAATPREFAWDGLLARSARLRLPDMLLRSESGPPLPFDFRGGRVEPSLLPAADLRWAFARPFQQRARLAALAGHADAHGWPPLREEIARHLAGRGLACDAADVAVVGGLQHAIDLVAGLLVEPGDAVVVEQPGYFGATLAFAGRGADLLGVEVDDEGLRTDRLARVLRLRRPKLVYVTPATQSPTGVALSPARRAELLALADEHQVPIFEDDYDSDLRYRGPALPALKASDPAGQVIYAGTFSKILFPGLRVGYVVAARPLLARLVTMRWRADFGGGVVEQAALATLLTTRGLDRHLRRVRRLYAERLEVLASTLARTMPPGVRWRAPASGHHLWVGLPAGVDPDALHEAARARGVAYTRGEVFFADGRGGDQLSLAFSALDAAAIREGVGRLAAVLRSLLPAGARATSRRAAHRPAAHTPTRRRHGAH
ncbi:MAG: PLP-dependent aminotransferase family protein [bacterium]|nr:PLP-dependent aminotransferase family protein [bacterium]